MKSDNIRMNVDNENVINADINTKENLITWDEVHE